MYDSNASIRIHALRRRTKSLRESLADQQSAPFFPVSLDQATDSVEFIEHDDDDTFDIGDTRVTCRQLNHPMVTGGFRLEANGHSMAYVCDADMYGETLFAQEMPVEIDDEAEARRLILQGTRDLGHGVDLLVCDTFFLPDEYRPDFGHSSVDDALRLAAETEAQCVALYHHRPGREDAHLDAILDRYRGENGDGAEILGSSEGLEITL